MDVCTPPLNISHEPMRRCQPCHFSIDVVARPWKAQNKNLQEELEKMTLGSVKRISDLKFTPKWIVCFMSREEIVWDCPNLYSYVNFCIEWWISEKVKDMGWVRLKKWSSQGLCAYKVWQLISCLYLNGRWACVFLLKQIENYHNFSWHGRSRPTKTCLATRVGS